MWLLKCVCADQTARFIVRWPRYRRVDFRRRCGASHQLRHHLFDSMSVGNRHNLLQPLIGAHSLSGTLCPADVLGTGPSVFGITWWKRGGRGQGGGEGDFKNILNQTCVTLPKRNGRARRTFQIHNRGESWRMENVYSESVSCKAGSSARYNSLRRELH